MRANAIAKTIRRVLGVLQDEPDNEASWSELREALGAPEGGGAPSEEIDVELLSLLSSAREAHEMRREYDAVAQLLEIEVDLADDERKIALLRELARVRDEELLDDTLAVAAYDRLRQLVPTDLSAEQAIERSVAKRAKWKDLVQRYVSEANGAGDASFKSSLLVSAAETTYRYGIADTPGEEAPKPSRKKGKKSKTKEEPEGARKAMLDDVLSRLVEALTLDPKSRRAMLFLERVLREEGRFDELAVRLETFADEVPSKEEKIAAVIRLARVFKKKLGAPERAAAAYERVLDLSPGHLEATGALVDHFTERQMWDHLVSLYEGQLQGGGARSGQEFGIVLQIAMVNWKMRNKPEAAEPHFEKVRKLEPAHPGMLAFFREFCAEKSDPVRLLAVLGDAQRALPEGPERSQIAVDLARLAEESANAQKAIDQWRSILRSEPQNVAAREALKRLYRQTGAFHHLADVLRGELDLVAPEDAKARLPILSEISTIYRDHIKSDSALVTILSQIIALDPSDATAVRELARVYESLGRWRDLLTTQLRLAELEPDVQVKAELYRSIARRWLDQFSNVQNAVEAYERLRELQPTDREALEKLKELYTKRRAYRQLYDLHQAEAEHAEGAARLLLWNEMANLAANRLDRGADASRLYKQILAEDPNDTGALDALEKQAERDKDFVLVAETLEARARAATDDATRLTVLQKLGGIYTDRLQDNAGALRTWRRVLDLSPGHAKALRILRESYLAGGDFDGLTALYEPENDWDGLVEVLSAAADRTTDPELKIALSLRCVSIYEEKFGAKERALRAYERILSVRPDDEGAARALVPIYENEEKWGRLPDLLGVLLAHAKTEAEQRDIHRRLATIKGKRLGDRAAAFEASRKAFELAPADPESLLELEEWARASGEWTAFAEALEKRSSESSTSDDERRALQLKLAHVSAVHAGKPEDAIRAYRALLEQNPGDEEALASLDRLLRSTPEHREDLRWLFRHRVDRADAEAKRELLLEWAMLEEEAFGAPDASASLYREVLALDPEDLRALRALVRLLLASGDYAGAAPLIERRRDLETGSERTAREIELARLYLGPLKMPTEALSAAKRALEEAPGDPQLIAIVEELLPVSETRVAAATTLVRAYEASGAWAKQADVLGVLIATAASKRDRIALHQELAEVKEKLSDETGAFDVLLRAAQEGPSELGLWDRLGVLASKTRRTQAFVDAIAQALSSEEGQGLSPEVELDLAERAAVLYDEMLGDVDRASVYLERVLTRDPTNARAFGRLKQILTARERWRDLEALYERVLTVTEDPSRRVDLLFDVAIVAEEITNDAPLAIRYYERILELEPASDAALSALDKLYSSEGRFANLADLLERRIARAGDEATELHLRLGALLFEALGDPKSALNHLEAVVTVDSSVRQARELIEKCLAHPDLRQRAAILLESVYTEREEVRELVRVLEVRLEFAVDDTERRELLRRIAELRDERLTDDPGAFEAYARLLPLSPGDVEARQRYLEIAARRGLREQAAEVLLVASKNAETPEGKADLLFEVARIFEETNAVDRAEAVHRDVLALAPEDPSIALPAARALERIYASRPEKSRELANVLAVSVKLEEAPAIRREIQGRIARLSEDVLGDDAAAITAWKAIVEDEPSDAEALASLDRLYERNADHKALVDVLRAREQRAEDASSRKELMVRTAQALADRLGDVPSAIVAYRAVLDDFGADRDVLRALGALYEKSEAWPDLAETLESELPLAHETADRASLLTSLGEVRKKRLGELPAAIDAYREALTLDPENLHAKQALEGLLDDEGARVDAADILRPLYERGGNEGKLARVLDIQIDDQESLDARLSLLARAADVAEGSLQDLPRAFAYAARGVREAASEASLADWLARAERLAGEMSAWASLVQLYRDVGPDVADEEARVDLFLRTASLARTKLADAALAKEYYRHVLDARPEHAGALVALEELYTEAHEHERLLEILGRRAELATTDDEKRAFLERQARICEAELNDRDRAIEINERILELGFDPATATSLERLYTALSRWGDLVALHEQELGRPELGAARRADLHHALGDVHERELGDMDRAFEEFGKALEQAPLHEPTIASLERRMAMPTHAGRAAEMLEQVYVARVEWKKVASTLEVRLAATEDPDERQALLRRLAKLHEEQEENYDAALGVTAKLLHEDPTSESTWAELERLARVINAEKRLAEIFATELDGISADEPATARLAHRTGELFESQGDHERALGWFRRAYKFDPEAQQEAFSAIDRVLTRLSRPADRVALYREALEYRDEDAARVATLHAIATIEEDDLHDEDAAIQTYRSILDVQETELSALESLTRLYVRRERFRDLADLHRRRAEQATAPEEEAAFRLELARVLDERLAEPVVALDELETVVTTASPSGDVYARATTMLEGMLARDDHKARVIELLTPIYERHDEWAKLVDLAGHKLAIASAASDKVAVLRERAKLLEERGHDLGGAFDSLREAFVLDPDDGETREQLDRVASVTERWDDLALTYEKGIANIDGVGQRELLEALAKLHDQRRDDPRRALDAWERLFKLDESDERPLDEMDQLATLLSDWNTLVRVLAKRADLTPDEETRASVWRRIGEARRDMLDDLPGAIDAYDRALELEPESTFTLDNLIAANEARSDATRLVELYRRRIELCGEGEEELRHQLLLDSSRCYEVGLNDRREAIALLDEALKLRPSDPVVLERLGSLFEAEKMWPERLENLEERLALEPELSKKMQLKKQIAKLQASELDDPEAAVAAYQEVLGVAYDDESARALLRIGESRDELRAQVADVLEPVVRAEASRGGEASKALWELVVEILTLRLRSQVEPEARAATHRRIAEVTEGFLGDLARAEDTLLAAIADTPVDPSLHAEIERVAALVERPGVRRFERYAEALSERSVSILDAKVNADLLTRLGRISEIHLEDMSRAADAYARAAERGGDTEEILVSLERIFGIQGDARSLADVLERHLSLETDRTAQARLLYRLAKLQLGPLEDPSQGLATLQQALDRDPSHAESRAEVEALLSRDALFEDAFGTLEQVYRAQNQGVDLARLYGRRVDRAEGAQARTRARMDWAHVLEKEAADPVSAQRTVEAALLEDPTDPEVLAELERLAAMNGAWAEAASAFAQALASRDSADGSSSAESWARLGAWRRDRVNDMPGAEEAYTRALARDGENVEHARALEALTRGAGRERDRVAILRRLVALEGEPEVKQKAARDAMSLAETSLSDLELAEGAVRDLLATNDADAWALEELTRLRELAGDYEQVARLLTRRADGEIDAEKAVALRHRAARVVVERLSDKPRAVTLYEQILEQEPDDAEAQTALLELYEALGKSTELGKLLALLVERAESTSDRSRLRQRLATLQLEAFGATQDAIDTLRAILDEEPDSEAAAAGLAGIFERTGQNAELAELQQHLVERARARNDAASELEGMVKLGDIYEARLADASAALKTYEDVLAREPSHPRALSAVARLAEQRGQWERASAVLEQLATSTEGDVSLWLRLAKAREALGDDEGVERALSHALAQDRKNADVRKHLEQIYLKTKKWTELADLLTGDADILRDDHPEYEPPPSTIGQTIPPPASERNAIPSHVVEQIRILRRVAEIHLRERHSPESAVPILERVTRLSPDDRDLLLMLCDAYSAAHMDREVALVLERVIASFGNKRTKELSVYHHRLGRARAKLGDADVALAQFDMAFRINPGSVEVLRDLGVLALENNDLERAQKTFQALLLQRLDASTAISKGEVFFYLGEVNMKQGNKAKAMQMLERAIENEPSLDRAKVMLSSLKN